MRELRTLVLAGGGPAVLGFLILAKYGARVRLA
jgi:hypothetical protein